MGWWSDFDRAEVAADFARIAASGLDSIRLFLTWADFQPAPDEVDRRMLDRLIAVADLAAGAGLALVPTLFTGHMSGVNWIPAWALGGTDRDDRFRVVSNGRVNGSALRNWYSDPLIARAQALLATETAGALAGHEAVWMWDLGNENSNCVIPPTRSSAREWLRQIVSAIRTADPKARVTVGLHMEDLENDRVLGPREASEVCDVLSMHGYPIYARWADGPTDEQLLPFLADVTRWLAGGRDVLFAEFGLPTYRRGDPVGEAVRRQRRKLSRRGAGCGGLHRTSACGVAAGRLRGRDALVLLRLRLGHLGQTRRSTSPSTSARSGSGGPTARPSPPSPSWRRSPALGDSPARTNTRGSISSPRSSSSSRTWRFRASTLGIARASGPGRIRDRGLRPPRPKM